MSDSALHEPLHLALEFRVNHNGIVIRMAEWKCGDIPYILDAVAPFGDREKLMAEFGKELTGAL